MENNRNRVGSYFVDQTYVDDNHQLWVFQLLFSEDIGIQTPVKGSGIPSTCGASVRLVKDVTAPSGINDAVAPARGTTTRKVLNNGKLYIMKDGKVFNAQGAQLR